MIGGSEAVFEKIKPYLEPMGKRLYYCGGPPALGLQAKLTQNLILANICMAFNEGMVLAVKGGRGSKADAGDPRQQRRQVRAYLL